MTDEQESSYYSDSDSSDSSSISWPDLIKTDNFALKEMDSSSDSDSDININKAVSYFEVKVLKVRGAGEKCSPFERLKTGSHSDAFFKEIVKTYEMFPDPMKTFLSENYKGKLCELSNLRNGKIFIYLARSLIVTMNVDNPRVRVPRPLVFDACIISEDNPVVVLSVFVSDTKNMDMYNTFVARGVTNALRTWSTEDISITNRAVTIDNDLGAEIKRLWKNPGVFHIQTSLQMWRDKAEKAAIALLKSVSVASSFLLLYPDKAVSDHVWFLTETEFQILTNVIDLHANAESATAEGDGLLLQTELCFRLRKRYKTALLMTSVNTVPGILHSHIGDTYTSLNEFNKVDPSTYELVLSDAPPDRKRSIGETDREERLSIVIEVTTTSTYENIYSRQSMTAKGSEISKQTSKDLHTETTKKECASVPVKCDLYEPHKVGPKLEVNLKDEMSPTSISRAHREIGSIRAKRNIMYPIDPVANYGSKTDHVLSKSSKGCQSLCSKKEVAAPCS